MIFAELPPIQVDATWLGGAVLTIGGFLVTAAKFFVSYLANKDKQNNDTLILMGQSAIKSQQDYKELVGEFIAAAKETAASHTATGNAMSDQARSMDNLMRSTDTLTKMLTELCARMKP